MCWVVGTAVSVVACAASGRHSKNAGNARPCESAGNRLVSEAQTPTDGYAVRKSGCKAGKEEEIRRRRRTSGLGHLRTPMIPRKRPFERLVLTV